MNEPVLKQMSEAIERQLDRESTALYGGARLWDDGIIDPRDTRKILSLCLAIAAEGDARLTSEHIWNCPIVIVDTFA